MPLMPPPTGWLAPGGKTEVLIDSKRCMGDVETTIRVIDRATGKVFYRATDPSISGMAFHKDGSKLYIQKSKGGRRVKTTLSMRTGRRLKSLPPSKAADIVMLTDMVDLRGRKLPDAGEGRFHACHPSFVLTDRAALGAGRMTAKNRAAAAVRLAKRPPSQNVWEDLLWVFKTWRGEAAAEALTRVELLLKAWPDELRGPAPWMDWLTPHPAWALVTQGPRELSWSQCGLDDSHVALLSNRPQMAHVTHLDLRENFIGQEGAVTLATSPYLGGLETLQLSGNAIHDGGASALAHATGLTNLRFLCLNNAMITTDGARELARTTAFTNLRYLYIKDNDICEAGLGALLHSEALASCRISQNAVNEDRLAELRSEAPPPEPSTLRPRYGGRRDATIVSLIEGAALGAHRHMNKGRGGRGLRERLKIRGADLSRAEVPRRDYRQASFWDCDFTLANLTGANLGGTEFIRCVLDESGLSGVSFLWARCKDSRFVGVIAVATSFSKTKIEGGIFRRAQLDRSSFTEATITSCDFREAKLGGVDFTGARFERCDFRGSLLEQASFTGSQLVDCDFRGTDLSDAQLAEGSFENCKRDRHASDQKPP